MSRSTPITPMTRWADSRGRTWRTFCNLHFGRYLCCLADNPTLTGEWTAKEIRKAMLAAAPKGVSNEQE